MAPNWKGLVDSAGLAASVPIAKVGAAEGLGGATPNPAKPLDGSAGLAPKAPTLGVLAGVVDGAAPKAGAVLFSVDAGVVGVGAAPKTKAGLAASTAAGVEAEDVPKEVELEASGLSDLVAGEEVKPDPKAKLASAGFSAEAELPPKPKAGVLLGGSVG